MDASFFIAEGDVSWHPCEAEEHGTAVWNLIDGHRTVREIISLLARHFGEEENYIPRVTAYVMQLRKDGFIQLTIRN